MRRGWTVKLVVPMLSVLFISLGTAVPFGLAGDTTTKSEATTNETAKLDAAQAVSPAESKTAEPKTGESKLDAKYPFRTDFANAQLPWFRPKAGQFPPHHSDHRVGGELVSVDFIRRLGQFRMTKTGELVDFVLPPYGTINYLNAEADLRDVPLGTFFLFFLNQDSQGRFTRLAAMKDQFSMDASHGFSYRLDEIKLGEGKLLTTKQSLANNQPGLGKQEWLVNGQTRVWKGDKPGPLSELAVGDELLVNITGKTATRPGVCTDIWVGTETHRLATEQQRKKNVEFVRFRGLPGWIDKTEGNTLTVTLFSGDWHNFKQHYLADIAVGKEICVVVANEELRTWNPPTDKERSSLLEIQSVPTDCYGCSGVRLIIKVPYMLEGFRKGRVVRMFGPGWKIKDSWYGESLMGYGFGRLQNAELVEMTPKEYPVQFPYRTEYGNEHLPWYKLQPGIAPPMYAEHVVFGDVIKADSAARTIQFRPDRVAADAKDPLVLVTLLPEGAVKFLNAKAELTDIPPGTRCRFHLFQDEHGAFTQASLVSDEFSYLAGNALVYRVEAIKANDGKLVVARQMPEVKNYNGDMEQPPDIGRLELLLSPETRVWKGEAAVKLADLAVGDLLLVNLTGEQTGTPSRCTDIWIDVNTHKLVTEQQSKAHLPVKKK